MPTAGSVYPLPSFESEHIQLDLECCLTRQWMLRKQKEGGSNTLTLRTSPDLAITQVIGPVNLLSQTTSMVEVELLRYDPGMSITVFYRFVPEAGLHMTHSFFQATTKLSPLGVGIVENNVWSLRIHHASDDEQFLETVDEQALALCLAKLAVNHANLARDGRL